MFDVIPLSWLTGVQKQKIHVNVMLRIFFVVNWNYAHFFSLSIIVRIHIVWVSWPISSNGSLHHCQSKVVYECVCACVFMFMFIYVYMCMSVYVYVNVNVYVYVYVYVHLCLCLCSFMFMHVMYVCTFIFININININTHTHKHT